MRGVTDDRHVLPGIGAGLDDELLVAGVFLAQRPKVLSSTGTSLMSRALASYITAEAGAVVLNVITAHGRPSRATASVYEPGSSPYLRLVGHPLSEDSAVAPRRCCPWAASRSCLQIGIGLNLGVGERRRLEYCGYGLARQTRLLRVRRPAGGPNPPWSSWRTRSAPCLSTPRTLRCRRRRLLICSGECSHVLASAPPSGTQPPCGPVIMVTCCAAAAARGPNPRRRTSSWTSLASWLLLRMFWDRNQWHAGRRAAALPRGSEPRHGGPG